MPLIHLQGRLICRSAEERRAVLTHLPLHMRLTLREPGCLLFDLAQGEDPMVWSVEEVFASYAAYETHQKRSAQSDWGRATLRIRRDYRLGEAPAQIAPETPADLRALYLLIRAAHGRAEEAELVAGLRRGLSGAEGDGTQGDLAASLVARFGRAYLGHIALARLPGAAPCWLLGPISLRESCRGQGLGTALLHEAIAQARATGVVALFALQPPGWLGRFGFQPASGFQAPMAGESLSILRLNDLPLPPGPLALPRAVLDYLTILAA